MKNFFEKHGLVIFLVTAGLAVIYIIGQSAASVANAGANALTQSEQNALQVEQDLNPFYWISAAWAKVFPSS
jgi:hypothetical protein